MKKAVFLVIAPVLLGLFAPGTPAQAPPPPRAVPPPQQGNAEPASPCPKLVVQSPNSRLVREGQPVLFTASLAGGDPKVTPSLIWNVSAGAIMDGQGTRRIQVDSTGAGAYRQIVADVWLGGYPPECASQATATVNVVGPPNKIDEFGELEAEKEKERIASVATTLSQSSDNLFVIAYAGRTNVRGYANTGLRRIKAEFTTSGIPGSRIGTIDGGFREQPAYEFWIVPEGADQPNPTPTVDGREIVYPKITPVKRPSTRRP